MDGKKLSILGLAVSVLAMVWLVRRGELLGDGLISIMLQSGAVLFMIWARITFGMRSFHASADATEGDLVTNGPFAIVRNPIYAACIAFVVIGVAVHPNLVSAALALAAIAGFLVRIHFEERYLRERYPAYAQYARRVKRIVPYLY